MKIRFRLRWLLLLMIPFALAAWLVTQAGMQIGHVKIVWADLRLDENGNVDGQLQWRFSRADDYSFHYADFVCQFSNVPHPELVDLEVGDRTRIRYRLNDVGPLPRQDPYRTFLNQRLGIRDEEIVGSVKMEGWTEILIRGVKEDEKP